MKITDLPWIYLQDGVASLGCLVGAGKDDCSVVESGNGFNVYTTDFVNSKPAALSLGVGTLRDVGYLAVIANLSDLLGSGAIPTGMLVGVQLAKYDTQESYFEIMSGVSECLSEYSVPLLGGDTKKGVKRAVYGVGIGFSPKYEDLFIASRAKPGDQIMVSGELGAFNAAVYALTKGDFPLGIREDCIAAVLKPKLNVELSKRIAATGQNRAGTDISDGLGADLVRLAKLSSVGVRLIQEKIPISPLAVTIGRHYGIPPHRFVFATGGDWQFAVTGEHVNGAYAIGEIIEEGYYLNVNGCDVEMPGYGHDDEGFDSFSEEVVAIVEKGNF